MKKNTLKIIYDCLSFLKENYGWLIGIFERAAIWKWAVITFQNDSEKSLKVVYIGRRNQHARAIQLLGLTPKNTISNSTKVKHSDSVIISECPLPNAICTPVVLSTMVRLGQSKSFNSAIAQINRSRVRYYNNNRHDFRLKQLFEDADIDFVNETMLKPYAASRHGDGVSHLSRNAIIKIARYTGALHAIYFKDEVVGCKISKAIKHNGQHYWRSIRAGYPEHIFSEPHLFGEIHNMNIFLAMEWAFNHGYDYFDKSICLARPHDKVLQWKRSYRGLFSFMGNYTYFHVLPPQNQQSTFFWHSPLFAKERGKLVLHIGIPLSISDEEATEYLSYMGFGGLSTVYLHCDFAPSARLIRYIDGLYKHFDEKPTITQLVSSNANQHKHANA